VSIRDALTGLFAVRHFEPAAAQIEPIRPGACLFRGQHPLAEAIDDEAPLFATFDQRRAVQNPQMVGNQRQIVLERERDLPDRLRTATKQIDDPQAQRLS
jgi:hypothetical protein